ncbi:MAG: molybdopterin-dependent oxidoreductase [Anaerolineaceae bacterium]|nr:molybdopterin-dependent oxidoreductase [Anaerolineaceae bacterium]
MINNCGSSGSGVIGKRISRRDVLDKVTGKERYSGDLSKENMLTTIPVHSPVPHGIIRKIDTKVALSVPGVVSILTAADIPGRNTITPFVIDEQPFLSSDRVRSMGDVVCIIAAEDELSAQKAKTLIELEIDELPIIDTPQAAMKQGAYSIHPKGNVVNHVKIRHGDIGAGFRQADIVVEGNYYTPLIEHAYIEPDAALSYYDDDGTLVVNVGTQGIYDELTDIAEGLALPHDRVRIIQPAIGGAFGGKEETYIGFFVALVTYHTKRPAKMVWNREDVFMLSNVRHASYIYMKTGATRDGYLTALQADLVYDTGAYAYWGPNIVAFASCMASGPYVVPNAWVDGRAVYTNNLRAGSMRGWGAPQVAFAWESQMDRLAVALKIHPLVFRWKNAAADGSLTINGSPFPPGVGVKDTIRKMAELKGVSLTQ